MAPETPGNLLIMNLRYDGKDRLLAAIEAVEPSKREPLAREFLHVRFDEAPDEGYETVGGGVVHVRIPEGFIRELAKVENEVPDLPGVRRYTISNVAQGDGLQLILILPVGFSLSEFNPTPTSAKEFEGRLAVYFRPPEMFGATATITWGLKKLRGSAKSEAKRLRGEFVGRGSASRNPGAYLDREDPDFKEVKSPAGSARRSVSDTEQPLSAKTYLAVVAGGIVVVFGQSLCTSL